MASIRVHGPASAGRCREAVRAVWEQAFGAIADVPAWTEQVWERHRSREGYRLAVAERADAVVGFAWGYTGSVGQFWSDLVLERLGPAAAGWVGGHFEFVELAVVPSARSCGLGGALHDRLLEGLTHQSALLGTVADPQDPAVRLYSSRGWRQIGLLSESTQVMALQLCPSGTPDRSESR